MELLAISTSTIITVGIIILVILAIIYFAKRV